jgi:hypothetical protein
LKWAEIGAAELRGEVVDNSKGPVAKKQIKKRERGDHTIAGLCPSKLSTSAAKANNKSVCIFPQPDL